MRLSALLIATGVAVACAVGGCAQSITNWAAPERAALTMPADRGRIILSAGSPAACLVGEHQLTIARRGTIGTVLNTGRPIFANAVQIRSDYSNHFGTLNVIQLRAGEYEVRSAGGGNAKAYFSLSSGETVYLGEIFITEGCAGTSSPAVINDNWERDLEIIRARNPELANAPVARRILEWTPN